MSIPALFNTDSNHHQSKTGEFREHGSQCDQRYSASRLQSFAARVFLRLRWDRHRLALLRVFLRELRSFLHRIVLQYKRCYYRDGLDVGPAAADQTISPQPCGRNIRTRACSESIESFAVARPWATMVDFEVYRDAWAEGANWAENNICKSEHQKLALETPDGPKTTVG